MDYFFFSSLCLSVLLVLGCFAQDDKMEVRFDVAEPIIYSNKGAENIELTCILNRGLLFVTQNRLEIIHQNPVTKDERTMALSGILQDGAEPKFYDIKIDPLEGNSVIHIIFTIKSVRDEDDGPFICKATDSTTQEETSSSVDIVVVREVNEVLLEFDSHEPVSTRPEDPIEVDAGSYQVKCMAVGSNPATEDIKLYLDGIPVESEPVSVTPGQDTNFRTFVSTIVAQVDIRVQSSGKDLQCVAKDTNQNTVTSELGIKVNTYDPHVMCNDSQAHEGQMDPILVCIVNHTDIVIEGFAFQIGRTGEVIDDGGSNADNVKVTSKEIGESVSEVSLNLGKAQASHFEEDFYIIIKSKGGHITKERVSLIKMERKSTPRTVNEVDDIDGDSASVIDGRAALIVSTLICLLVQLF